MKKQTRTFTITLERSVQHHDRKKKPDDNNDRTLTIILIIIAIADLITGILL